MDEQESLDITQLNYSLYVRKSIVYKERQLLFVEVHITECDELFA